MKNHSIVSYVLIVTWSEKLPLNRGIYYFIFIEKKPLFCVVHLCCTAVVSTQEDMIDYLVGRYPFFKLHATEKFVNHPIDTDREKLIYVLQLVGAARISHVNANTRKYGLSCLRGGHEIVISRKKACPAEVAQYSFIFFFERLVLRNKREIEKA